MYRYLDIWCNGTYKSIDKVLEIQKNNRIKGYCFMRIWNNRKGGRVLLRIEGIVDACNICYVRDELDKIEEASEVFIDLSMVDFLNTFFVDSIVETKRRLEDCKFYIVNPTPNISEILELMYVDQLAPIIRHNTSDFTSIFI